MTTVVLFCLCTLHVFTTKKRVRFLTKPEFLAPDQPLPFSSSVTRCCSVASVMSTLLAEEGKKNQAEKTRTVFVVNKRRQGDRSLSSRCRSSRSAGKEAQTRGGGRRLPGLSQRSRGKQSHQVGAGGLQVEQCGEEPSAGGRDSLASPIRFNIWISSTFFLFLGLGLSTLDH